MTSWRASESQKQARSRHENECTARARAALSGQPDDRLFRCECGAEDCTCAISLTLAEYESVRAFATRFVIARNHENPESERIVTENKRFAVIEAVTTDEVKRARKTDPRGGLSASTPNDPVRAATTRNPR